MILSLLIWRSSTEGIQKSFRKSRMVSRLAFSTMSSGASEGVDPIIAHGHDEQQVLTRAARLTSRQHKGARRWYLTSDAKGVERVFRFKTFKATWEFMDKVAGRCKEQKHHPEWTNIYNKTHIVWTTHKPSGLSTKDVLMADYCDEVAADLLELEPDDDQLIEDERLFRKARIEAPDCCTKAKA